MKLMTQVTGKKSLLSLGTRPGRVGDGFVSAIFQFYSPQHKVIKSKQITITFIGFPTTVIPKSSLTIALFERSFFLPWSSIFLVFVFQLVL